MRLKASYDSRRAIENLSNLIVCRVVDPCWAGQDGGGESLNLNYFCNCYITISTQFLYLEFFLLWELVKIGILGS
jgi:hypothetical protein